METDLVTMVISFMDQIFGQVFAISDDPRLLEWGDGIINQMVERTENQINDQLGK